MGKYGTNLEGFGAFEGGVNADKGAPLVSTSSDGETALLFGPAALREIQAGVANGDFAIPPDAAGDTVTEENPLPYWTFTDVNSAGAITAAIVADAGAGSGNVLRFTVASGTLTGKSATLTRYVPVASSASRSFSFYAEATFDNGTNSTQATAKLTCEFYKADGVTATGTPFESDVYGFNSLQGPTGITAPDLYAVAPDLTNTTAPADAAYVLMTITIATIATQSANRVVDLTEVRLAHGLPELILTDKGDPATYQPAYILSESGDLSLVASTGENLVVGMNGYWLGSVSNTMESGGDLNLIATGDIIGTGENISLTANTTATIEAGVDASVNLIAPDGAYITTNGTDLGVLNVANVATTGDLRLLVAGGDVFLHDTAGSDPRLLFRNSSNTFLGGIQMQGANVFRFFNGDVTNDYAYIYAERFYPMNGTTASRYIYDDGTRTHMTGGLDTDGSIVTEGSILNDSISTTTATANAAIWVLSSGTAYTLRRNSSSARYKTNIVDADEAVLEAARKIKPRHYESTIADEAGTTRLGFIAEEVEAAGLTHAVGYDGEGRVETIDATALIAALYARVNDLEERLAAMESR
jgi:hypothetical protein